MVTLVGLGGIRVGVGVVPPAAGVMVGVGRGDVTLLVNVIVIYGVCAGVGGGGAGVDVDVGLRAGAGVGVAKKTGVMQELPYPTLTENRSLAKRTHGSAAGWN